TTKLSKSKYTTFEPPSSARVLFFVRSTEVTPLWPARPAFALFAPAFAPLVAPGERFSTGGGFSSFVLEQPASASAAARAASWRVWRADVMQFSSAGGKR